MRNLTIKRTVECNLTADQWQLYTASPELESRVAAATRDLNDIFARAVNKAEELSDGEPIPLEKKVRFVSNTVYKVMKVYSDAGALDSEPLWVLDRLILATYGDEAREYL